MIKLENLTPEVYYKQSRDFQFIGRLYDIVLNSVKTNIDLISSLPLNNNLDNNLVSLLATTLGFKTKHNYNLKQLNALTSAFSLMLREKGTKKSIQTAIGIVLNAEGIINTADNFDDFINVDFDNYNVDIFIPKDLSDFTLLNDILDYILPAGMSCNIIKGLQKKYTAWTEVGTSDLVTAYKSAGDPSLDDDVAGTKGISFIPTASMLEEVKSANANDFIQSKNYSGLYINSTVVKFKKPSQNEGE